MRKSLIAGAALLGDGFALLLLFLLLISGGGNLDPVMPLATDETTIRYAEECSKLNAPWEIAMLADTLASERAGKSDIEDVNPLPTALQFAIMTVTTETLEVRPPSEADAPERRVWQVSGSAAYTGRDAILSELGISDEELSTADDLLRRAHGVMALRSTETRRYTASFSGNYDLSAVLSRYIGLSDEERQRVMDLYESGFLLDRLDDDTRSQVRQLMAENGMYQYVELSVYESLEGVTFTGGATPVTYYCQLDERWAGQPYGTDKIGSNGCGPTAMAIVISSLTEHTVDPVYMANWAYQNGYWAKSAGSYHTLIRGAAAAFGLTGAGCPYTQPQQLVDALESGKLVVALMGPGHFTNGGHFIVLRGVTEDGQILVADPASYAYSQQPWPLATIIDESIKTAGDGGPFWVIGR